MNLKTLLTSLSLALLAHSLTAQPNHWTPSPWDHTQTELTASAQLPIKYPSTFQRERETLGYNPRFLPWLTTFTPDNSPVIRTGVQGTLGSHQSQFNKRPKVKIDLIQQLQKDGKWRSSNGHIQAIRKHLKLKPEQELEISTGINVNSAVEFDREGHAYTLVEVQHAKQHHCFLLYSPDQMQSWQVYPMKQRQAIRIQPDLTHNRSKNPPTIVSSSGKNIFILKPQKTNTGTLDIGEFATIPTPHKVQRHGLMAGAGSDSVTVQDKTFVIYMSQQAHRKEVGTPQYIVSYDHNTQQASGPHFLGTSGHQIDGHNSSVMLADSKGHIHILLGTHWHSMVHIRSSKAASIAAWDQPIYVAGHGDNSWSRNGLTYPGFCIDANDNFHLVVRGRNRELMDKDPNPDTKFENYDPHLDYALVYLRKKAGHDWEKRQSLVVPKHMAYSNWYHRISVNAKGQPHLAYCYYAHNLNEEERKEYTQRWGGSGKNGTVSAHDAVLTHTADAGDTWQITQTPDLLEGIE